MSDLCDQIINDLHLDKNWIDEDCNASFEDFKSGEIEAQLDFIQKEKITKITIDNQDSKLPVIADIKQKDVDNMVEKINKGIDIKIDNEITAVKIKHINKYITELEKLLKDQNQKLVNTREVDQPKILSHWRFEDLIECLNKDNL